VDLNWKRSSMDQAIIWPLWFLNPWGYRRGIGGAWEGHCCYYAGSDWTSLAETWVLVTRRDVGQFTARYIAFK
jgi:hypothetical protein